MVKDSCVVGVLPRSIVYFESVYNSGACLVLENKTIFSGVFTAKRLTAFSCEIIWEKFVFQQRRHSPDKLCRHG